LASSSHPVKPVHSGTKRSQKEIRTVTIFQGGAAVYMAPLEVLPQSWTVAAGQNHSLRFHRKSPKIQAMSQLADRNEYYYET